MGNALGLLLRGLPFRRGRGVGGGGPAGGALTVNLTEFWTMDDANADHGGRTLTLYNSPTFTAGLIGNALTCDAASTQYAARAYEDALSPADDHEWFGWVKFSDTGADRMLVNIGDANAGNYPHSMANELMYTTAGGRFRWICGNNTTSVTVQATYPVPGTWYGVNAYHDVGTGVGLSVNGAAHTTAAYTGGSYHPAYDLTFGKWANYNSAKLAGQLALWGLWSRLLLSAERSFLYNSGAGRTYAEVFAYRLVDILLLDLKDQLRKRFGRLRPGYDLRWLDARMAARYGHLPRARLV